MPLVIGLVALVGAALLLASGITDASFADVATGKAGELFRSNQTPAGAGGASSSTAAPVSGAISGRQASPGDVNPVPGARGGRLDQGFDVTGDTFLAPFAGRVVASVAHDPGWRGGGYVAVADIADPSRVVYFAEGILPTVQLGELVQAGQQIASPVANPYNGIVGNIEFGLANPGSPGQPLAQATADARSMVLGFYNWVRAVGGPAATSTSNAGSP